MASSRGTPIAHGLDDRNSVRFLPRTCPADSPDCAPPSNELHRAGRQSLPRLQSVGLPGTRREGQSNLDVLCGLVRELDADGLFLDTMDRGAGSVSRPNWMPVRPGSCLEGEAHCP